MLSGVDVSSVGLSRYESTKILPPMKDFKDSEMMIMPPDKTPKTNRRIPAAFKSVNTRFPSVIKSLGATGSIERRPTSASAQNAMMARNQKSNRK